MGNIHEQIDRLGRLTPRTKVIAGAVVLILVAAFLTFVFWLGARSGEGWAENRYIRERDERQKKIEKLLDNERQLAGENALLKKQNEAIAETLAANDAKLAGDARVFQDLITERNRRLDEIDADASFDAQLCGFCEDAARSGFPLSDKTCGRCRR